MPRKKIDDIWTREIIAVHFDEEGKRTERDFDLIPEEEKKQIRERTNARALAAAGFIKMDNENVAE